VWKEANEKRDAPGILPHGLCWGYFALRYIDKKTYAFETVKRDARG
jgi:hypothetical protein